MTEEELFQNLRYEIEEDDDTSLLYKGISLIRKFLAEQAFEKDKKIEQLKTQLEIEKLEKEVYYNRLILSDGGFSTGIVVTYDKDIQKSFDELQALYKKREELKKKIA